MSERISSDSVVRVYGQTLFTDEAGVVWGSPKVLGEEFGVSPDGISSRLKKNGAESLCIYDSGQKRTLFPYEMAYEAFDGRKERLRVDIDGKCVDEQGVEWIILEAIELAYGDSLHLREILKRVETITVLDLSNRPRMAYRHSDIIEKGKTHFNTPQIDEKTSVATFPDGSHWTHKNQLSKLCRVGDSVIARVFNMLEHRPILDRENRCIQACRLDEFIYLLLHRDPKTKALPDVSILDQLRADRDTLAGLEAELRAIKGDMPDVSPDEDDVYYFASLGSTTADNHQLSDEDKRALIGLAQDGKKVEDQIKALMRTPGQHPQLATVALVNAAIERIIISDRGHIRRVAEKFSSDIFPLEVHMQNGAMGLRHAVFKFDLERTETFMTYSGWWIRQHIIRGIQEGELRFKISVNLQNIYYSATKARRKLARELGREPSIEEISFAIRKPAKSVEDAIRAMTYERGVGYLDRPINPADPDDDVLGDFESDPADLEEDVVHGLMIEEIGELISLLPEDEASALILCYGLDGNGQRTLREICEILGLNSYKVKTLIRKAIDRLRESKSPLVESLREYIS